MVANVYQVVAGQYLETANVVHPCTIKVSARSLHTLFGPAGHLRVELWECDDDGNVLEDVPYKAESPRLGSQISPLELSEYCIEVETPALGFHLLYVSIYNFGSVNRILQCSLEIECNVAKEVRPIGVYPKQFKVQKCPTIWQENADDLTGIVFYQGMYSSQTQLAKYTGDEGFTGSTGERIVCDHAVPLIQSSAIFIGEEISEVNLSTDENTYFGLLCRYISNKANQSYGTRVLSSTGEKLAHSLERHSVNFSQINIGQEGDMNNHAKKVAAFREVFPDRKLVLFGVSRGAATTFNSVCSFSYSNLALVVLEGCFDSVRNVLLSYCKANIVTSVIEYVISKSCSYSQTGVSPLSVVDNFPKDVPVAFITSKADTTVPMSCTLNLVSELIAAGHPAVYLLVLNHSSHPRFMMDNSEDTRRYLQFIHTLYKQLNLPHIAHYVNKPLTPCNADTLKQY